MTSSFIGARYKPRQLLCVAAIMAAICGIFLIDSFSTVHITIAVLYILVLLISINVLSRKGVLIVGCVCVVLTFTADFTTYAAISLGNFPALARCLISGAAIGVATWLVLRSQAAAVSLADQIRILEQTHDAIIVRDLNYRITHWNQGAATLFGWSADEATGQRCYALLCPEGTSSASHILDELLNCDRWEGEEVFQRRDGVKIHVASRWTLRRDAKGVPRAIISASNDISAFRQAEEALSQSQAQLAHATRITMLGELMASIAHEVNQPLAAISTYGAASLRWLQRDQPDIGEATLAVSKMISDSQRASEVIRRIRALSRKSDAAHAPLDLHATIDESLALLTRELSRKEISLVRDFEQRPAWVHGDRVQLQQVIINLVINSVQALNGREARPRQISLRTRLHAGSVLLDIADTGPGFAAEQLPQLFDAFFTTKRDGMGLGLSICKSIVESHAGEIRAFNVVGGAGATLQISLPVIGAG